MGLGRYGWLGALALSALRPRGEAREGEIVVCVAVADHFEPFAAGADEALARRRVEAWVEGYHRAFEGLSDALGRMPRHDFFYPLEQYRPWALDMLGRLKQAGVGEVEVHLHHQHDTSQALERRLKEYVRMLHERHGLLRTDEQERVVFGFIHGNWALDNSDPLGRWCGVNDEISVLARCGCYADFTMPSAPHPTQTRTINSIYYAIDDPSRPKSHDTGLPARVGQGPRGDLLMVQGVLALDWTRRKWGLVPRLENSCLDWHLPPHPRRVRLWVRYAPVVKGAEHVRFVKLHCHGAIERNREVVLGRAMRQTLEQLLSHPRWRVVFCSCWEMVRLIHALEKGLGRSWEEIASLLQGWWDTIEP